MPHHAEPGPTPSNDALLDAGTFAPTLPLQTAPNGIRFATFGDTSLVQAELARVLQAVPVTVAPALATRAFYFVPLALPAEKATSIAPTYTLELADQAICHRDVDLPGNVLGVFISARLLRDQFALAFEFFINAAHAFASIAGVPQAFQQLAWTQAQADVRGETSQDAWEFRAQALQKATQPINEKARSEYFESAFADALAIYMLSLAVDFDYAELREREYPLLAPTALADRLRLVAALFPPNEGYDFAIRYRRR